MSVLTFPGANSYTRARPYRSLFLLSDYGGVALRISAYFLDDSFDIVMAKVNVGSLMKKKKINCKSFNQKEMLHSTASVSFKEQLFY